MSALVRVVQMCGHMNPGKHSPCSWLRFRVGVSEMMDNPVIKFPSHQKLLLEDRGKGTAQDSELLLLLQPYPPQLTASLRPKDRHTESKLPWKFRLFRILSLSCSFSLFMISQILLKHLQDREFTKMHVPTTQLKEVNWFHQ